MKIANDAKQDLKELAKLIDFHGEDHTDVEEKCVKFFKTYGSHATLGPFSFGGHIWRTCSSKGFNKTERDTVKNMQRDVISASAGVTFLGFGEVNIDETKGRYEGKCPEDTLASTRLQIKISGGPPEDNDIPRWKKGLVTYNSTWVLTDRGKKLIAVWDIIKLNHEGEFGGLNNALRSSWERMTGLQAERDLLQFLTNLKSALQQVKEWNEEGDLTPQQIQGRIKHLTKVRKEIVDKTGALQYWTTAYLEDPTLQEFLLSVANAKPEISSSEHIKFSMKQLVVEYELSLLDILVFPNIENFSKWLGYPSVKVIDFQSFNIFLEQTTHVSGSKTPDPDIALDIALSKTVEQGINLLRSYYKNRYEDVLIAILIHPHQYQSSGNIIRLSSLKRNNLVALKESFEREKMVFDRYKGDLLKLQSYLLLLTLSDSLNNDFIIFKSHIGRMMRNANPPPNTELLEMLNRYQGGYTAELTKFKKKLQSLLSEEPFCPSTHQPGLTLSLTNVLRTKIHRESCSGENVSSLLKENVNAHALFEKLGLSQYYPKLLKLQDALSIRTKALESSLSGRPPNDLKQLTNLVLHKLMSYDTSCRADLMRSVPMRSAISEKNGQISSSENAPSSPSSTDSEQEEEVEDMSTDVDGVHPIDCLLALILCSDDFLCQDLLSRMAKCQLAIPFLLPDPFTNKLNLPLWAMRSIIKEWKDDKEHIEPIVHYPMPIVSFIRFGEHQRRGASKSSILNDIISDSQENLFFRRNNPGGQYNRILGEGLVDMCWYLPTGKPNDHFPNSVTFLNLHGDARQHPDQTRFLSQISSICFVLITDEKLMFENKIQESLKKFKSSPGGITILDDTGKGKDVKKTFSIVKPFIIDLASKTDAQIKDSIRLRINSKLFSSKLSFSAIEDSVCFEPNNILIDEYCTSFNKGRLHASTLMDIIIRGDEISSKEAMIPLQGDRLWKFWAVHDKDIHRQVQRGKDNVEDYTDRINNKKVAIRTEQLKYVYSLTPVMESFIVSILYLGGDSNRIQRNYFLQCLKLELNNISRRSISGMQNKYQSARNELSKLQAKSVEQEQCLKKLKGLQEDIVNFSFGLEHLLRELGQIYEAALQSHKYGDTLSYLPKAAAELLIDGFPLELMDGDAAHVPLKWVTAVLKEAIEVLGDPEVFVLSVLGLQSTGKSTLLNTTFGIQFNVSAGRCTRGAFMQLLPLDNEMKDKTNCSHILIVDTEGLRAPELDPLKTQKHDNELATFVIGLANTTLINIYGEVTGDMDDILQTSVHAFLRMTEVEYQPSCRFVHQNAGASFNGEVSRALFTQKLNQFTLDAVKAEKREHHYETFKDVIQFDDQNDVDYFPGLWKGDPPMAPVNQGYSNAAQKLKQQVVNTIYSIKVNNLSSFQGRIEDLWNALLKENFVFSFKNTLEINAYRSLETAYGKWAWKFEECMQAWEQSAENVISTESDGTVTERVEEKLVNLREYAQNELYIPLKAEMEEHFNGKQSEIVVKWKATFELKLENLSIQLILHTENHCKELLNNRKAIAVFQEAKKQYVNFIKENVHQYITIAKQEQENLKRDLERGNLRRDLFTPDKTALYLDQQIITPDQANRINTMIQDSDSHDPLTEDSSEHIVVNGILTAYQVEKLLKTIKRTDHELDRKFESIWIKLIEQLPPTLKAPNCIADDIENALNEHVKGDFGKLIVKIQKTKFKEWGPKLELISKKNIHFEKLIGNLRRGTEYLSRRFYGTSDPYEIEANEITQKVFDEVDRYLKDTIKKDTNFNSAFITKMLILIDEQIEKHSSSAKQRFNFLIDYKLEMYLIACSYSIPLFERMARLFTEKNDPLIYLEKHERGPLLTMFKNQYNQTEAEEAIANALCAYIEEPIREQIERSIVPKMVDEMKGSEHHFSSKMALKVRVLTDICEGNKERIYQRCMAYVKNVRKCLEKHIHDYTVKFCDREVGENTRLQQKMKKEVTALITAVENVVTAVNETNIHDWLSNFRKNETFRSKLGADLQTTDLLSGYDSSQPLDLDNFKLKIRDGLEELKKILHASYDKIRCEEEMEKWKVKPHELLNSLIGCTEQCPFCGEQCDMLDPHHYEGTGRKHQTAVHRMDGLAGWRITKTEVLGTDFCQANIASNNRFYLKDGVTLHPYKKFQDVYPAWSIPPDTTAEGSLYWKWFVGKYPDALASEFHAKPPKVQSQWSTTEWDDVKADLKDIYKL